MSDFHKEAGLIAELILVYFDSYKLGSMAPITTEIEKALVNAFEEGQTVGFAAGKEWAREMLQK